MSLSACRLLMVEPISKATNSAMSGFIRQLYQLYSETFLHKLHLFDSVSTNSSTAGQKLTVSHVYSARPPVGSRCTAGNNGGCRPPLYLVSMWTPYQKPGFYLSVRVCLRQPIMSPGDRTPARTRRTPPVGVTPCFLSC